MNASISVGGIVGLEGSKDAEFDAGSIAILLDGANNLDGDGLVSTTVAGLDDLAKGALAEQTADFIYAC